ncbi:MAG: CinA family nicotinamide mononucleotide deamidase-related protein, partial [Planctomycetes bacterium]|nr:CinA family nicotinamide mononucleotide deamidase-related protein [Planctomycetota bacterium]
LEAQAAALRDLAGAAELVVVTGGLGPTDDDLTREALRMALGESAPLVRDAEAAESLHRWFRDRGRAMPEINARQALRPAGARCLANDFGTAPGLQAAVGEASVFCLPGPPREMQPMFERFVSPVLPRLAMATGVVHAFGQGESFLAERLGERMRRDRNPLVGTTASGAVVSARVRGTGSAADPEAMERELLAIEALWAPYAFGRGETTLAGAVGQELRSRGLTLALAESCTGGLAGSMVTAEAGSSAWFRGGVMCYANEAKRDLCGVRQASLDAHGAVSEAVAVELADGVRSRLGADWAASITGIAGPSGGSEDKPVGTVFIGVSGPGFSRARRFHFPGERASIRDRAARGALALLRLAVRSPQAFAVPFIWEWKPRA